LYVAADGPRSDHPGEKQLCQEVRDIATTVDWPCQVRTLFRDNNLGCGRGPSSAINWFFENEESGIILEDDCLPDQTWFLFAEELLERYKDDERIMNISAQHFHLNAHTPRESYFFSRYFHCWGWASWRRTWKHFEYEMRQWRQLKNTDWLISVGDGSKLFRRYWTRMFDTVHNGKNSIWDFQWTFSCWARNGLTILPSKNLVTNIGFGPNATHSQPGNKVVECLPLEKMEFPLVHPSSVVRDVEADRWTDRHVFDISMATEINSLLHKLPFVPLLAQIKRRIGSFR
jgi:hypothetical protein